MEKKTLALYIGIVIIGIGVMVGVVLFLRSRAQPAEDALIQTSHTSVPGTTSGSAKQPIKGVKPFRSYEDTPKAAPYKDGDPLPVEVPWPFEQPDFTKPTSSAP